MASFWWLVRWAYVNCLVLWEKATKSFTNCRLYFLQKCKLVQLEGEVPSFNASSSNTSAWAGINGSRQCALFTRSYTLPRLSVRPSHRQKPMIWLVEWWEMIVLHVRHAFWCNFFFILGLYMKTTRTKQAKVCFAYFVQSDQPGIIAKHLN